MFDQDPRNGLLGTESRTGNDMLRTGERTSVFRSELVPRPTPGSDSRTPCSAKGLTTPSSGPRLFRQNPSGPQFSNSALQLGTTAQRHQLGTPGLRPRMGPGQHVGTPKMFAQDPGTREHISTAGSGSGPRIFGTPGKGPRTLTLGHEKHMDTTGFRPRLLTSSPGRHMRTPAGEPKTLSSSHGQHMGTPGLGPRTITSGRGQQFGTPGVGPRTSGSASRLLSTPGVGPRTLDSEQRFGTPGVGPRMRASSPGFLGSPPERPKSSTSAPGVVTTPGAHGAGLRPLLSGPEQPSGSFGTGPMETITGLGHQPLTSMPGQRLSTQGSGQRSTFVSRPSMYLQSSNTGASSQHLNASSESSFEANVSVSRSRAIFSSSDERPLSSKSNRGGPSTSDVRASSSNYGSGSDGSGSRPRRPPTAGPSEVGVPQNPGLSTDEACSSSTSKAAAESDGDLTDGDVVQVKRRRFSGSGLQDEHDDGQVYLSVVWNGGCLGVAYYDMDTTQIFMMLDAVETEEFQLLQKVRCQVQPTCIVTSSKQDDRMLKVLKESHKDVPEEEGMSLNDDYIQVLPSIDFSLDICKRRILSLNLPNIPQHYTDSERTLYMSSLIAFENVNMVRAVGGLLKYLDKKRVGIELEEAEARVPVLALKTFSLEDLMIVDDNTYSALQIFQKVSHPSAYKQNFANIGREGLSVFGILNRCKSQIGSKMMRLWFLRPLRNQVLLQERLDAVAFFTNPRHLEATTSLQNCLKHIRNLPRILARMTQAQASLSDWQAFYKTVYNAIYIRDICCNQSANIPIFRKIVKIFTDDLHQIATLVNKIVDFEESAIENRFVVKPNVDEVLDEKKRNYNGLPDFMTRVAQEELNKLSDDITECKVLYIPQLGYMLSVPTTDKMKETKKFELEGLDFMFHSNDVVHYKSTSTKELDHLLGDTQCDITDLETQIMHRLQNAILKKSKVLIDIMHYAAELDCMISLAVCARECNYVKPELTASPLLEIKGGRHPLQELCCTPFVPNDSLSGGEHGKMKVLTGPNASGKSIYLKQIALIVFMAHIGSFVPAESAVIGVTDRIFTRVRTMESVSVGLSTFMIDLNQVSIAVRNATEKSLVILDEFGKGTECVDGLSLLCSCLTHWLSLGASCPHTFVSTHFHSLIQQQLLPKTPQLNYMTMEVLRDGNELVFLYQLVEGSTNTSYACHIASLAGLPEEVVTRGSETSELLRKNQPVHRIDSASTATLFKRCEAIKSRFLDLNLEKDDLQVFLQGFVSPVSQGKMPI